MCQMLPEPFSQIFHLLCYIIPSCTGAEKASTCCDKEMFEATNILFPLTLSMFLASKDSLFCFPGPPLFSAEKTKVNTAKFDDLTVKMHNHLIRQRLINIKFTSQ